MKPDQQSEIILRLRSASGHLTAVIEMTEAGKPCEQVLHQLNAVEAALRAAGARLIICQVKSSRAVILASTSPKQRTAELERFQSLYVNFVKFQDHNSEVTND
jgi:DNA-binding FrmR family transcriptional regulator